MHPKSIEPFDPHIRAEPFSLPHPSKQSKLDKRAHTLAILALSLKSTQAQSSPSSRTAQHYSTLETKKWLKDVHRLCKAILKEGVRDLSPKDLHAIKQTVIDIHEDVDRNHELEIDDGGEPVPSTSPFTKLLETVESDLTAIDKADHFFNRYDAFEQDLEEWNLLAENPIYQDKELLKENAHDSLKQYIKIEQKFAELRNIELTSLKKDQYAQKKLLKETLSTLKAVREDFTKEILPTLREKLEETKKACSNASKAMERPSSLRTRWKADSAASLIEDFSRFQHALADVRHQRKVLEEACETLPKSRKTFSRSLHRLFADAAMTGKSMEFATLHFLKRLKALPQEQQNAFLEQLKARIHPGSPSTQEARALLKSMGEAVDDLSARDDLFLETKANSIAEPVIKKEHAIFSHLRKLASGNGASSHELYGPVIEKEYQTALVTSHAASQSQEERLTARLERGMPLWKQRSLGAFFLALHAGTWVQSAYRMQGQSQADEVIKTQIANELVARAPKRVQLGASFIAHMLSDRFDHMQSLSDEALQYKAGRYPEGVLKMLQPYRGNAAPPSSEEIAALSKEYLLRHAAPSLQEQMQNWFEQLMTPPTTPLGDVEGAEESQPVKSLPQVRQEPKAFNVNLNAYLKHALDHVPVSHSDLQDSFYEMIQLVKAGADPNLKNVKGASAFDIAMAKGVNTAAVMLLQLGADPNAKDENGIPALHVAIKGWKMPCVPSLLEGGADPNLLDPNLQTPLQVAIDNTKFPVMQRLIASGNQETIDFTPIELLIAKGANVHAINSNGDTLFHQVLQEGWPLNVLRVFLDAGADVNARDGKGNTPLHLALDAKNPDLIKELVARGANIDGLDAFGKRPLACAFSYRRGDEACAVALIQAGADLNAPDENGYLPLRAAVHCGMPKAVKALIEKGVDFRSGIMEGETPFQYALAIGASDILRELINAGIDPNVEDGNGKGKLAIEIAVAGKQWFLVEVLLEKGAHFQKKPAVLKQAIQNMPSDHVKNLTKYLQLTDYPDVLQLSNLVRGGKLELLSYFIDQGLSIDQADKNGMTALHWAAFLNLPGVANFLLTRGADGTRKNRFDMSALDLLQMDNEKRLTVGLEIARQHLEMPNLPQPVREKLADVKINRGISNASFVRTLWIPANASTSLDVDAADLVSVLAVRKQDSVQALQKTIPQHAGALRQRLGALTGDYLDNLLQQYRVTGLAGFHVPATIIQTALNEDKNAIPVSVTDFVSSSQDIFETDDRGVSKEEYTKLLVLDILLGNTDRHLGNYRVQTTIDEKGNEVRRLIPIDHDLTMPDLTGCEFLWVYDTPSTPFSEEWKVFIVNIDPDALWKEYEKEAAVFDKTYAGYTRETSSLNDDIYLNFRARIKVLQEGVKRGISQDKISKIFLEEMHASGRDYQRFFEEDGSSPKQTLEERVSLIFGKIEKYFDLLKQ